MGQSWVWLVHLSNLCAKDLELTPCQYSWFSITPYFSSASQNTLFSVSLPQPLMTTPFSARPDSLETTASYKCITYLLLICDARPRCVCQMSHWGSCSRNYFSRKKCSCKSKSLQKLFKVNRTKEYIKPDRPVKDSCFMWARARASWTPSTTACHASVIQQHIIRQRYFRTQQLPPSRQKKIFSGQNCRQHVQQMHTY